MVLMSVGDNLGVGVELHVLPKIYSGALSQPIDENIRPDE